MLNNIFLLDDSWTQEAACLKTFDLEDSAFTSDYNCYWVTGPGWPVSDDGWYMSFRTWQRRGFDPHGMCADPALIDTYDLHLRPYSKCITEGTPVPGITTDIDGDPRDPLRPDIGADEYGGGWVAETRLPEVSGAPGPTIVRGVLRLSEVGGTPSGDRISLFNATGRRVLGLSPTGRDARSISPGVYFLAEDNADPDHPAPTRKVILIR